MHLPVSDAHLWANQLTLEPHNPTWPLGYMGGLGDPGRCSVGDHYSSQYVSHIYVLARGNYVMTQEEKNLCCWSWQMLRKKLQINLHHGPWESGLHLSSTENKQGESFGLCRHSSIKAEERGRYFRKCRFWTILEHRGLSLLHHQSWTNVNMDLQSYQPHPSHSSHDPKFSSLGAKWSQSCGPLIVKRC